MTSVLPLDPWMPTSAPLISAPALLVIEALPPLTTMPPLLPPIVPPERLVIARSPPFEKTPLPSAKLVIAPLLSIVRPGIVPSMPTTLAMPA